jgi:hypothetical protein
MSHSHIENFPYFMSKASMDSGILRAGALMEFRLIVWDVEESGRGDFKGDVQSEDTSSIVDIILPLRG